MRQSLQFYCFCLCVFLGQSILHAQFIPHTLDGKWSNPMKCWVMDINEDGNEDILTVSGGTNTLSWMENLTKNEFASPRSMNLSLISFSNIFLDVKDMDGNGKKDVVIAYEGELYWLGLDKYGEIEQTVMIDDDLVASTSAMHIADIDTDGDMDIVLGYREGMMPIHLFVNNGDGTFESRKTISNQVYHVFTLSVADMNGDGHMDILSGSAADNKVAWYPNTGSGFLDQRIINDETPTARVLFPTDLDNDGDMDLICPSSADDKMVWYENAGLGNFLKQKPLDNTQDWIDQILFEDLDNDGLKDIISISHDEDKVTWSRNLGTAAFDTPRIIDNTHYSWMSSIAVGDMDRDGDLDLVYNSASSSGTRTFSWRENNSGGDFSERHVIYSPPGDLTNIAADDLDGDDDKDIIAIFKNGTKSNLVWYGADGKGRFSSRRIMALEEGNFTYLKTLDVEGDGDIDIVGAASNTNEIFYFENDGVGNFNKHSLIKKNILENTTFLTAKINRDAFADIVIGLNSAPVLNWIELKGNGQESISHSISLPDEIAVDMHYEMADMDGDGDMDVFVKGKNEELRGFVYWLENDENHSFENVHVIAEDIASLGTTRAVDINADGHLDLAYIYGNTTQLIWLMNDGTGNMIPEERMIEPEFSYIQNAVFGDIDADGDMDMVSTYFSQYHVKLNDGNGNFSLFYVLNDAITGLTVSDIVITDLDGDYHNDLLVREGSSTLYWLENILDHGIQGRIFMDFNENGIYDEGDAPLLNQKLKLQPLNETIIPLESGYFFRYMPQGDFVLSYVENTLWESSTGVTEIPITIDENYDSEQFYNIGFKPTRIIHRIQPYINTNNLRCNTSIQTCVSLHNSGTMLSEGILSLEVGDLLTLEEAIPAPDFQEGNTLFWNISGILPSQTEKIKLQYAVPSADFIGEWVDFDAQVELLNDENQVLYSDDYQMSREIRCSYDPNDKLVYADHLDIPTQQSLMQDTLYYTIRFQNTGNDTAYHVNIYDEIHEYLNLESLQVISSSHSVQTTIDRDRRVKFQFDNIMLPDSTTNEIESNGFVLYGIAPLPVHEGLRVKNTAYIYFDFNPPIITNTTDNMLVHSIHTGIEDDPKNIFIEVYPNPLSDYLTVELMGLKEGNYQLVLTDLLGREVSQTPLVTNGQTIVPRNNLQQGLYLFQIWSEESQTAIRSGKLMVR